MNINYDNLYKVFITDNNTLEQTASFFGISVGKLRKELAKNNIKKTQKEAAINSKKTFIERYGEEQMKARGFGKTPEQARAAQLKAVAIKNSKREEVLAQQGISKDILEHQYLTENMSLRQLCDFHNLSKNQVRKLLVKFDIKKSPELVKEAKQRESKIFYEDESRWKAASIKTANTIKETYGNNWYRNTASKEEEELAFFIESFEGFEVQRNTYNIIQNPNTNHWLQLDLYIPELYLAFEYNGVYWHDKNKWLKDKKDNTCESHEALKEKLCLEKNITLYHIWSDEWKAEKEKLKENISKIIISHKQAGS